MFVLPVGGRAMLFYFRSSLILFFDASSVLKKSVDFISDKTCVYIKESSIRLVQCKRR